MGWPRRTEARVAREGGGASGPGHPRTDREGSARFPFESRATVQGRPCAERPALEPLRGTGPGTWLPKEVPGTTRRPFARVRGCGVGAGSRASRGGCGRVAREHLARTADRFRSTPSRSCSSGRLHRFVAARPRAGAVRLRPESKRPPRRATPRSAPASPGCPGARLQASNRFRAASCSRNLGLGGQRAVHPLWSTARRRATAPP